MATNKTDSLDADDFSVDICLVDTDQYSHPYITSIFAHVAKFYQGQDRHHLLEGFSKIAKMYESKDGKIAMDGWNCIHYGKDKNGRLVSGGREWTLKKICDTVNNPTTLREFVIWGFILIFSVLTKFFKIKRYYRIVQLNCGIEYFLSFGIFLKISEFVL